MICKKCKQVIEEDSIFCRFCGKKLESTSAPPRKKTKRPSGTGNVSYLKSSSRAKPYIARKCINGKQILIGYYATKTEALAALEEANRKITSDIYDMSVQDAYDMVISQNENKLTESGLTNYKSGYRYLSNLAHMKMRDIRTAHFQDAIMAAREAGVGYATWKKIQNIASLMCKVAMANNVIQINYAQLVNMPESKKKTDKTSFSSSQLAKMWDVWESDSDIAIILAMCYNGLRINEFFDIKKEHTDLNERVIFAPGSKTESGRDRIIPIPMDLVPIYKMLLSSPGEYLVSSPRGVRYNAANYRNRNFYKALDRYGLNPDGNITPHSCRHTYATLCVKGKVDEKATMDFLGHSKYATTLEIYADGTAKDHDYIRNQGDKLKREM